MTGGARRAAALLVSAAPALVVCAVLIRGRLAGDGDGDQHKKAKSRL